MNIQTSDGKSKSQLDQEIGEALADTGVEQPVGYWPAFPDEPGEPTARKMTTRRASPSSPKKRKATRAGAKKSATKRRIRSKAKARPLKKKTARRASSKKPRARSTKKRVAKKKTSKKSTARKKRASAPIVSAGVASTRADGRDDLLSRVRAVVRGMGPEGRYGNKVFISEIYDEVKPGMPLSEFKRWLVGQNRTRGLTMARADLIGAMDPGQIKRSEISDMGATFHFVLDPDFRYGYG